MGRPCLVSGRPLAVAFVALSLALADGGAANAAEAPLRVVGGITSFELLPLFADAGLELVGVESRAVVDPRDHVAFAIDGSVSQVDALVEGRSFFGFRDGLVRHRGKARLRWPGDEADLSGFRLRPAKDPGEEQATFDLLDAEGEAVFHLDHAHPTVLADPPRLRFENMDLRITSDLAQRTGAPGLADLVVGRATVELELGTDLGLPGGCVPDFSGPLNVTLTSITSVSQIVREGGTVALAPSAALENTGQADVPWYRSIVPDGCGTAACVGDHPMLVMAFYRLAGGELVQLGRSDVKHAFYSGNTGCSCQADQVLYAGCQDVYGVNTNASRLYLAPRDEVTASTGAWSSYGSHFDGTPVDDVRDHDGENDLFSHRLTVSEADLGTAGARYFVEAWYLVAGDNDIFDSMGHREVDPAFDVSYWTFPFLDTTTTSGSIVDEWVDPDALGPGESNEIVAVNGGHLQLATRVEDLGGGLWRYTMALMNHDFDRQVRSLAVSVAGATVQAVAFSDGDADAANDWTGSMVSGVLTWEAPVGPSGPLAIDWGVLASFSFEADHPPVPSNAWLYPDAAGSPATVVAATFAPVAAIFTDGFESGNATVWSATTP